MKIQYETPTVKQYANYLYNQSKYSRYIWTKDWDTYRDEIEKKIREISEEERIVTPAPQQKKIKKRAKKRKVNKEKNKKRPKYGVVPPPSRLEGIE